MKKVVLIMMAMIATVVVNAQHNTLIAKTLVANDSIKINGTWYKKFANLGNSDLTLTANRTLFGNNKLLTLDGRFKVNDTLYCGGISAINDTFNIYNNLNYPALEFSPEREVIFGRYGEPIFLSNNEGIRLFLQGGDEILGLTGMYTKLNGPLGSTVFLANDQTLQILNSNSSEVLSSSTYSSPINGVLGRLILYNNGSEVLATNENNTSLIHKSTPFINASNNELNLKDVELGTNKITIKKTATIFKNDTLTIDIPSKGAGRVLYSDQNGNVVWQLPTSINTGDSYNNSDTLTDNRLVKFKNYSLTFDSVGLFRLRDTAQIDGKNVGSVYDFNNGSDFVVYDSVLSVSATQTSINGLKWRVNDLNNLDTLNEFQLNANGAKVTGNFATTAAIVAKQKRVTDDYTVAKDDYIISYINAVPSSTYTLTLPTAADNVGRVLIVYTTASVSINVANGTIAQKSGFGTSIGANCVTLQSDGTYWVVLTKY
jgi:hypothetical protein